MIFQESGYEIYKWLPTQREWNGDPQEAFRFLLRLRQNPLSVLQEVQRFLALAEVNASLRGQAHAPRGAPQERHAELGFQHRQPTAHRRDGHPQRARRARDALELGDLSEYQDVIEVRHRSTLPFMEMRLQRRPSNQARREAGQFAQRT